MGSLILSAFPGVVVALGFGVGFFIGDFGPEEVEVAVVVLVDVDVLGVGT